MTNDKTVPAPPLPPQWVLDLNTAPPSKPKSSSLPDPPGYPQTSTAAKRGNASAKQTQTTARKVSSTEEMDTLKMKKAWEVAIAPAKSLPMNAIGMWMTGNSLQIFSIFMLFTLFKNPIQSLMNTGSMFTRFESEGTKSKMLMVKIVYVLTNVLALSLGIYKVNAMGLLPTTRSDWLAWEAQRMPLERAYPDFGV